VRGYTPGTIRPDAASVTLNSADFGLGLILISVRALSFTPILVTKTLRINPIKRRVQFCANRLLFRRVGIPIAIGSLTFPPRQQDRICAGDSPCDGFFCGRKDLRRRGFFFALLNSAGPRDTGFSGMFPVVWSRRCFSADQEFFRFPMSCPYFRTSLGRGAFHDGGNVYSLAAGFRPVIAAQSLDILTDPPFRSCLTNCLEEAEVFRALGCTWFCGTRRPVGRFESPGIIRSTAVFLWLQIPFCPERNDTNDVPPTLVRLALKSAHCRRNSPEFAFSLGAPFCADGRSANRTNNFVPRLPLSPEGQTRGKASRQKGC